MSLVSDFARAMELSRRVASLAGCKTLGMHNSSGQDRPRVGTCAQLIRCSRTEITPFLGSESGHQGCPSSQSNQAMMRSVLVVLFWRAAHADERCVGGWQAGDVAVFKLEAHQLSMRVRRLGGQTFTMSTNGVQNLRVHINLYGNPTRVQLSRVEAHEEF